MDKQKRNIFIGLAWPYANGDLHLGHITSFIGGDVLARYHRLKGNDVLMVSGSDCYGTPIAVKATEMGVDPSEIIEKYHNEFKENLVNGMNFSYDIYTKTATEQHTKVVQELFMDLYEKGFLYTKKDEALYSPYLKRFLPDRFVEGVCPKCKYDGARGDQCDECGSLLDPLELINPKINPKILQRKEEISEKDLALEKRETEHFYLKLSAMQEKLEQWSEARNDSWRENARSFTRGFLKQGLKDRAITRDTEWGVSIPLDGYDDKRIYVWFEAVAGYLSASKLWSEEKGKGYEWKDFWLNEDAWHYYVHGKDNVPFHTVIWPAMLLMEGNLNTPNQIVSSELLTIEGKQFSKSRNWAVWLKDYLKDFDYEALRFFLTVNGPETSDADFSWKEYATKVNGELIGTFGNLVNRVFSPAHKNFKDGVRMFGPVDEDGQELLLASEKAFVEVGRLIEEAKFRMAFREILALAQKANKFVDKKELWVKIKDESKREEVETDFAVLIQVIRSLAILANPFLPTTSEKILSFIGQDVKDVVWESPKVLDVVVIENIKPLYRKIEDDEIEREIGRLGKKTSEF